MPARYAAMSLVLKMAFEFSSIEMSIWPRRRRTAPRHRFCPLLLAGPTLSNCMNIFLISRVHQRPASIIHTATNNQSLPVYQLTRSTQSFAHQSHCIYVLQRVVISKSARPSDTQLLGIWRLFRYAVLAFA